MENNENNVQNQVKEEIKKKEAPKGNAAKGFVVAALLIVFLAIGFGVGFLISQKWNSANEKNNANNTVTNNTVENAKESNSSTTEELNNNSIQNGKYKRTTDGEASGATLEISNATSDSFNFVIDAYRYTNPEDIQWCIDNGGVNIGKLEGIAKRIDTDKFEYEETNKDILELCGGVYRTQFTIHQDNTIGIVTIMASSASDPYCGGGVTLAGKYAKSDEKSNNIANTTSDYSVFSSYKGRIYKNEDFNTITGSDSGVTKENCELRFDDAGKPTLKIGYKSDNNTECYFQTQEISNLKSEGAAGTTYVTFDFTAWTAGGDTTGSATFSYSNVSDDDTINVSAKVKYNTGVVKEFNNIKVNPVNQTSVDEFAVSSLKNRVYESENGMYKVEFNEKGKPTITVYSPYDGGREIVGTYIRFTDVSLDNAAGSAYVTFSYRLENETGDKVEGRLRYSNNTDNNEIYLRMHNLGTEGDGIILKKVK